MAASLVDTNLFVDYLRGHPAAVDYFEGLAETGLVSVVTLSELHAGAYSQRESRRLEAMLAPWRMIGIDAAIARRAGVFVRLYGRSHGLNMPDALIAACAEAEGAQLHTRNLKHFPMLKDAVAPY